MPGGDECGQERGICAVNDVVDGRLHDPLEAHWKIERLRAADVAAHAKERGIEH